MITVHFDHFLAVTSNLKMFALRSKYPIIICLGINCSRMAYRSPEPNQALQTMQTTVMDNCVSHITCVEEGSLASLYLFSAEMAHTQQTKQWLIFLLSQT